ncbi:hypothetical protein Hamer_G016450 [Homarus americanus]|uniref:Uncharacterized protein n=1 Tax=Homarus americanus TaxID=6706 RepID=A0A8J5N6M0_HOMAM|nr:hypothetical protein Hamer_G016450 [Homarus americanus]
MLVLQARNNFQQAYNYLAELAHLAPDDPTTVSPTAQLTQQPTQAAHSAPGTTLATTPVPFPPGYQFGGLTPEVARATMDFFRQYVATANRAAPSPNQIA